MSELRVTTISDTAGTGAVVLTKQSAAKAWGNLNGTGTIAYNDSFNISSATDNGTGNYTHNYASSMNNSQYASSHNTNLVLSNWPVNYLASQSSGAINYVVASVTPTAGDTTNALLLVFGDLA